LLVSYAAFISPNDSGDVLCEILVFVAADSSSIDTVVTPDFSGTGPISLVVLSIRFLEEKLVIIVFYLFQNACIT
jgi:hypothetical protein